MRAINIRSLEIRFGKSSDIGELKSWGFCAVYQSFEITFHPFMIVFNWGKND